MVSFYTPDFSRKNKENIPTVSNYINTNNSIFKKIQLIIPPDHNNMYTKD